MIKLITSDMDGTLLNDKGEFAPDFFDVLKKLSNKNIKFAVASGRSCYALEKVFGIHKKDVLYISDNGGHIKSEDTEEIILPMNKDEVFSTIESVKAASEIYMPISGEIVEVNEQLINSPELINDDAFSAWLIKVKPQDFQQDSQGLLEYDDYKDEVQ